MGGGKTPHCGERTTRASGLHDPEVRGKGDGEGASAVPSCESVCPLNICAPLIRGCVPAEGASLEDFRFTAHLVNTGQVRGRQGAVFSLIP